VVKRSERSINTSLPITCSSASTPVACKFAFLQYLASDLDIHERAQHGKIRIHHRRHSGTLSQACIPTEAATFSHSSMHSLLNDREGAHELFPKSSTLNELMMLPSHPDITEYSTHTRNGQTHAETQRVANSLHHVRAVLEQEAVHLV
jgi:hypothetical protein